MNSVAALLVPAPVAEISIPLEAASIEERHQRMIVASADLQEALLEDLTTEGMLQISGLIDSIRIDLSYCRNVSLIKGETIPV